VLVDAVARMLVGELHQFEAAKELAEFGLDLNPTCSASCGVLSAILY
jgi:hypothetical protein